MFVDREFGLKGFLHLRGGAGEADEAAAGFHRGNGEAVRGGEFAEAGDVVGMIVGAAGGHGSAGVGLILRRMERLEVDADLDRLRRIDIGDPGGGGGGAVTGGEGGVGCVRNRHGGLLMFPGDMGLEAWAFIAR